MYSICTIVVESIYLQGHFWDSKHFSSFVSSNKQKNASNFQCVVLHDSVKAKKISLIPTVARVKFGAIICLIFVFLMGTSPDSTRLDSSQGPFWPTRLEAKFLYSTTRMVHNTAISYSDRIRTPAPNWRWSFFLS